MRVKSYGHRGGVLVFLNFVPSHVRLDFFSHKITMEALIPARCKTDQFHRIEHIPALTTDPAYSEFGYKDMTSLERKKTFSSKLLKFMNYSKYFAFVKETLLPGADPGFSVGGGANI